MRNRPSLTGVPLIWTANAQARRLLANRQYTLARFLGARAQTPKNPVNSIVVFIIVWWLTLLTVLPWGVRRTENPEAGHDQGARVRPMFVRKLLITTAITLVVFGIFYVVVERSGLSLRELADRFAL